MKKNHLFTALVASVITIFTYYTIDFINKPQKSITIEHVTKNPSTSASYSWTGEKGVLPLDFTETAEKVVNTVVHIKSTHVFDNSQGFNDQYRNVPDPFRDFFGDRFKDFFEERFRSVPPSTQPETPPTRIGFGSGVIVSSDGYILTNNHVIADADDIEVTLHDNRIYKATVIGSDPSTDLALLKIKEKNLDKISFVDSDKVRLGEWVLAVGNPFSLNSTVTAGIVSAKGRNINILREQYAVENFIQTDAVINPGNSGGALVDLNGGLIGINTAIASPTGVFSGYGFAVPSNIANKVMEDLIRYGVVQRGVLGIMIRTVDGNLAKENDLDIVKGVYVDSLMKISAAKEAGLKVGDIIIEIDDVPVNSSPELQGLVARHRPGEKVTLLVNRKGKELNFDVTLTRRDGGTTISMGVKPDILNTLGVELENIDKSVAKKLDITGGVKVVKLYPGKLRKYTQMREGFIITKVDERIVTSQEELIKILKNKEGGVMLEGVYEDLPGKYYYAFGLEN